MRRLTATLFATLALGGCARNGGTPAPGPGPTPRQTALLAQLPPGYRHADLENGRLHFTLCRACHTAIDGGADMTGPNLYGVFGRKVASKPGYDYSSALRAKTWTWNADELEGWLKNPRAMVPGTKMSFSGLRDDTDRRDLIAYLKLVSSGAAS